MRHLHLTRACRRRADAPPSLALSPKIPFNVTPLSEQDVGTCALTSVWSLAKRLPLPTTTPPTPTLSTQMMGDHRTLSIPSVRVGRAVHDLLCVLYASSKVEKGLPQPTQFSKAGHQKGQASSQVSPNPAGLALPKAFLSGSPLECQAL